MELLKRKYGANLKVILNFRCEKYTLRVKDDRLIEKRMAILINKN